MHFKLIKCDNSVYSCVKLAFRNLSLSTNIEEILELDMDILSSITNGLIEERCA